MNNNLKTSIIYASMIGSLLNEYEPKENNSSINELKKQLRKFMQKRSKTNTSEFLQSLKIGNEVWIKSIDHFKENSYLIEAVSLVVALWSRQAETLAKFCNLTEKRIDAFALQNMSDNHTLESEQNSYTVANYLNSQIEKSIELLEWRQWVLNNNGRFSNG